MNRNGLFHTNCYSFSPLIEQGTAAHMNMNTAGSLGGLVACVQRQDGGKALHPTTPSGRLLL